MATKVIQLFSCLTQLSMKLSLLISMKMATIVGIFIFIREVFMAAVFCKKEFSFISGLRFISSTNVSSAELSIKKFYTFRACFNFDSSTKHVRV